MLLRTRGQLNRLDSALLVAGPRIRARHDAQLASTDAGSGLWLAKTHLEGARRAHDHGQPDSGWTQWHAALEVEVEAYTETELEAVRISLASEASEGALTGWPCTAVENLLSQLTPPPCHVGTPCGPNCPAPGQSLVPQARALLREALQVRNEYFEHLYTAIRVSAHRRILLLGIGVVLLVAAGVLIKQAPEIVTVKDDRAFIAACAAVAGMLGATTSAIQRLVNSTATIPAELDSLTATLTRPFIGAVGSLTALFAYQSGLLRLSKDAPISLLLLASFGVGFAERLVVYNPQQQSGR